MSGVFNLVGDDVLYEIFCEIALLDPPSVRRFQPSYVRIHIGCIYISHVCRRWRTILVHGMPLLWADLPCIIPAALDTIVERAHDLPLALRTRVNFSSERDAFTTCLNFSKRLREIAITHVQRAYLFEYEPFSSIPDMGWFDALNEVHLPHLRDIRLFESRVDMSRQYEYFHRTLHAKAPNLRHAVLSIRGFVEFPPATLTSLAIESGCVEILRQAPKGLLRILASQPLLESLSTSFQSLDMDWQTDSAPPLPVHLEHLKDVRISSRTFPDVLAFFQRIEVPSICQIRLSVTHSQSGDWHACVRIFERIALLERANTLSLHCVERGHYTYTLHHSPDDWDMTSPASKNGPMALFETDFNVRGIPSPSFTDLYLAFLDLPHQGAIRRLVFDETIASTDCQELSRSIQSHPSHGVISSLWLNSRSGYDLLVPQHGEGSHSTASPLPRVSELAIPHMHPPITDRSGVDLVPELTRAYWDHLTALLRHRAALGYPIRRIVLLGVWESEERRATSQEADNRGLALVRDEGVHEIVDRRTVLRQK
ncbi:unnamed protein product [Peniophora sp. CBMAI 1063]|nr:unnamed protein product [Peniophora sp. CBMAI 1063]